MGINLDTIFSEVQNRFICVNQERIGRYLKKTDEFLKENCHFAKTSASHRLAGKTLKLHFIVGCNMKLCN